MKNMCNESTLCIFIITLYIKSSGINLMDSDWLDLGAKGASSVAESTDSSGPRFRPISRESHLILAR